jgi:hypothetical protein
MFRKSSKEPQLDMFANASSMLHQGASRKYNDPGYWHNQFRRQVIDLIEETPYKVLFNETTGAPNAPIRLLVGMMILKEAFGWSDSQLFEHCQFNLLTRSALGLVNINDVVPSESTYYLLRKRIYDHRKQTAKDLLGETFEQITREQVKQFEVNGRQIRMDSKLIGSNIAHFSRYEIIHQTLSLFCKALDKKARSRLSSSQLQQLDNILGEEPGKTVYRSSREEIQTRSQGIGPVIYQLLDVFADQQREAYKLLQRVFDEQYQVVQDKQVKLRPKEDISSGSVQSPHDPDSAYRHKADQKVKGYSVNITETTSDESLNLITNVLVDQANVSDPQFVQPAIEQTHEVTGQQVDKAYLDGAYQSPDNDQFCEDIDMVFTGLQGSNPRFDLEMTSQGLMVTDTQTGHCMKASLARKNKNSKEDRWVINIQDKRYYFNQQAIRAAHLRRELEQRPEEELRKRNNVEASIFQLCYPLRNNKTKYRGLFKQQIWAYCRCLWINFVRIAKFFKQSCQRTFNVLKIQVKMRELFPSLSKRPVLAPIFNQIIPIYIIISFLQLAAAIEIYPF